MLDGSVTWCAQREPTIHAYSPEDLGKDMAPSDAELVPRPVTFARFREPEAALQADLFLVFQGGRESSMPGGVLGFAAS